MNLSHIKIKIKMNYNFSIIINQITVNITQLNQILIIKINFNILIIRTNNEEINNKNNINKKILKKCLISNKNNRFVIIFKMANVILDIIAKTFILITTNTKEMKIKKS